MRKTIYSPQHKAVAACLRRARLDAGLNQSAVAKRLRKPQSYVSRCETGDHRLDVVELQTFARIYKKSLDYFMAPLHSF
ncbi:MAG: helix-turn-helix transcriptional regulator [Elusimicrobia bacterium]|nr:helix-turn-helix transcriptional regulator [Elusimicrobiota bacterium]